MRRVVIVGAGGHAQVIADALLCAVQKGATDIPIGYVDDDPNLSDQSFLNLPVLGPVHQLKLYPHEAIVVAIGNNQIRQRLYHSLRVAAEQFVVVKHPAAVIASDVFIGLGTMICAGVVINSGSYIGENSILNTSCTADHHSRIGAHTHIAPGVHMGGEVIIEEGALVGLGATVLPRQTIGKGAVVGAGACVTKSVAPGVTVVGVPAKPLTKN